MVDNCEIITKSAEETKRFGAKVAGDLEKSLPAGRQGTVICLFGDLGSGKTTFMQGFAKGLGIKQRILSPTFVLMRQYRIENCKLKIENLLHVDLYRINQEQETESLGLVDLWSDPKNIIAIEWPEKIEKLLPEKRINIYFEYIDNDKRRISLSS